MYQTQSREQNYADLRFFFNILLEITCATTWWQAFRYYGGSSLIGACIMWLYDYDIKKIWSPLNTPWKYILPIYFIFLAKFIPPAFYYMLGIYIYILYIYYISLNIFTPFTKLKLAAGSILVLNLPEKWNINLPGIYLLSNPGYFEF